MVMMNTLKDTDCQGGLKENNNYMILKKRNIRQKEREKLKVKG